MLFERPHIETKRPTATGLGFTVTETARASEAVGPDPFIVSLADRPRPCDDPPRARIT